MASYRFTICHRNMAITSSDVICSWLDSLEDPNVLSAIEEFHIGLYKDTSVMFVSHYDTNKPFDVNALWPSIEALLRRFLALPRSQLRLKTFVFVLDAESRSSFHFYGSLIKFIGLFPRPMTLAVSLCDLPSYEHLGNIRRLYLSASGGWKKFFWLDHDSIRLTSLLDIGEMPKNPAISRPITEWKIYRPLDEVVIATETRRRLVELSDDELPYIDIPDTIPQDERDLAFAIRANRDLAYRFFDVCTLIMCARNAVEPRHPTWGLLNKDAVRLICSFLAPSDWNFDGQRKRNLTIKKPKWATNVISAYRDAQDQQYEIRLAKRQLEKSQNRRGELIEELRALPDVIRANKVIVEEKTTGARQARQRLIELCKSAAAPPTKKSKTKKSKV